MCSNLMIIVSFLNDLVNIHLYIININNNVKVGPHKESPSLGQLGAGTRHGASRSGKGCECDVTVSSLHAHAAAS